MHLFDLLADEYNTYLKTLESKEGLDHFQNFIGFCKDYLNKNQPIRLSFRGMGLSLELQQGQIVNFVDSYEEHLRNLMLQQNSVICVTNRNQKSYGLTIEDNSAIHVLAQN